MQVQNLVRRRRLEPFERLERVTQFEPQLSFIDLPMTLC
jgi:hypothetical protein